MFMEIEHVVKNRFLTLRNLRNAVFATMKGSNQELTLLSWAELSKTLMMTVSYKMKGVQN